MSIVTVPLRPEFLAPVALNPTYALSMDTERGHGIYNVHVPGRRIVHTQVPGGFWAVKVRPRGDGWATFAVPRKGTIAEPFDIAAGTTRESVLMAGIDWANSAGAAVIRMDRIVFAGFGDATEETPLGGVR